MLAIVPLSLYAGKKTLRPGGFTPAESDMETGLRTITRKGYGDQAREAFRVLSGLAISRHGMTADSRSTALETFDSPSRRSTKVIGTSATRHPLRIATNNI